MYEKLQSDIFQISFIDTADSLLIGIRKFMLELYYMKLIPLGFIKKGF